jgi:hypothetical protein
MHRSGGLQHEIEASMAPGDMLPIEPELEIRFGVSRITVRNATDALGPAIPIVYKQDLVAFFWRKLRWSATP